MELLPKLSPDEAKEKILQILEDGDVELSGHCRKRMKKRSAERIDVLYALQNGEIKREAEWDDDYENWKYRVEGEDIEGDELIVITVIIEADWSLKIVTIF